MNNEKMTYKDAGVDVEEGQKAVQMMKKHVKETFNEDVIGDLGSFGGLLRLSGNYDKPVLVAGTDGVGTKLKLAFMMDKHDTVGQDLVAMCVNDILCQGALPLFFLDYIATGKLKAESIAGIVKGVTDGCKLSNMPLLGGETAEMPGFYQEGEYDMAGFAVGVVDESKIIDGSKVKDGDAIIGLASSGIHSNGYSLVRKIVFEKLNMDVNDFVEELEDTIGNVLIEPTKIYVKSILKVLEETNVNGMVHMTGGGFFENIPRALPEGHGVEINLGSWEKPKVFDFLQAKGNVDRDDMFATFNMGIGFIIIADQEEKEKIMNVLTEMGETPAEIGTVKKGVSGVKFNV